MPKGYDVFLSYNRKDGAAVVALAGALRRRRLNVWFDQWMDLGENWVRAMGEASRTVPCALILVGPHGEGPWQEIEKNGFLIEFVQRDALLIPVLLPDAPAGVSLPPHLNQFNWLDLREGLSPRHLTRLAERIKSRRRPVPPDAPAPDDAGLADYRTWALDRYRGMTLIGLGAADIRMRFEEVYVPLRIARRQAMEGLDEGGEKRAGRGLVAGGVRDVEVEDVLDLGSPHALILGHPGAGKTTALLKLLHSALGEEHRPRGLAEGTVPVFLRLRRLTSADLDHPLAGFIERELAEVSGGKLPAGLGRRLWERGRLLLLLDGLDEIADEALRARVCRVLEWELAEAGKRDVRAVVSCRFAGYGGKVQPRDGSAAREVRFGEQVLPLEVRPLGAEQCRRLVELWFQEAARHAVRDYSPAAARKDADALNAALDAPGYGTQAWKVLIGSPLLLTLLCVIVLRGGQMPRQRVAFFDQSLRVLLAQWSRGKRAEDEPPPEPPLEVETALAVLRSLAWTLHLARRRDDLTRDELADHVEGRLETLGHPLHGLMVADWLSREAGVLAKVTQQHLGFLHLGLQEYLAALHVACEGEAVLDALCAACAEDAEGWWQEVLLLLVGIPGRRLFAPLIERLLPGVAAPEREALLRACLDEAAEVDLGPLLDRLGTGRAPAAPEKATAARGKGPAAPETSPEELSAVLRLLRSRRDPRLLDRVRPLATSPHTGVAALARQIVADLTRPAGEAEPACDLFVVSHPDDARAAEELAQRLRQAGWRVDVAGERPLTDAVLAGTRAVAVLAGPAGVPPWAAPDRHSTLRMLARRQRPLIPVRLPDAPALAFETPRDLPLRGWVDLCAGLAGAAEAMQLVVAEQAAGAALEPARRRPEPGEAWVEPRTGMRLLWIPGGRFQMGGNAYPDEQPPHWVRVSPLWLGETPVTNRQYAVFLEEKGHKEPQHWRDRRFSAPEQPVVGVAWEDARAFCAWLSEAGAWKFDLPSEAQWEFAARGTDGREYPWGGKEQKPDSTRACFGLNLAKGQPAAVGSFPAGKGPFGTLDQAGNVWEWCLDAWDAEAYQKRAAQGTEAIDPVVRVGGQEGRVVRGGGWVGSAESLRAACRGWSWARNRYDDIGFRVAAAPPST